MSVFPSSWSDTGSGGAVLFSRSPNKGCRSIFIWARLLLRTLLRFSREGEQKKKGEGTSRDSAQP